MKHTKGKWEVRKLFDAPIKVTDDKGKSWMHNSYSIHDDSERRRVICDVVFNEDTPNSGWGHNETISKAEANAKLIAAAPELLEACKEAQEELMMTKPNPLNREHQLILTTIGILEIAIKNATL